MAEKGITGPGKEGVLEWIDYVRPKKSPGYALCEAPKIWFQGHQERAGERGTSATQKVQSRPSSAVTELPL